MKFKFSDIFRKAWPYIVIVLAFVLISFAYAPSVLQGKVINQSDISSWFGMAQEIIEHNAEHPEDEALWTGSMFGGMPATHILVHFQGDWTQGLYNMLFIGDKPVSLFIISLLGGFLLFLAFGVNPWLSAVGAVAITFCSYNMQIIQVGHNTKMIAIAFMPWVLASAVYAYRRNSLLGAIFFALTLSFQIKANHPQITYYLAFIIGGYIIAELYRSIKSKAIPKWVKTSVLVVAGTLLGVATNANKLIPTYEYMGYSMRGGSELTHDEHKQTDGGLKLDYATAWSYGINETPNLLIPNFNGGASSNELSRESETYKLLRSYGANAESLRKGMPTYWGPQPFTAGPMYLGAISVFLFVFGLCVIRGQYKWWVAGISLLALLLSWGSHFMWFSKLFFDFAPLYNKFRTVSMVLVILQILVPLMGILAVNQVLFPEGEPIPAKKVQKSFLIALGVTGGFCLIFALFPGLAGNFAGARDADVFGNNRDLLGALMEDRRSLLRADAWRSLAFILAAAATFYAAYMKKLKALPAIAIIGALILVDLWVIDRRYLNEDHFVTPKTFNAQYNLRPVDKIIHQDTDPHYRVLDLTVNTFNDAIVSYNHKTIGGYNPAKIQRYQDLIDFHIKYEMSDAISAVNKAISSGAASIKDVSAALDYYPVLAMLNTKYIVVDPGSAPLEYTQRLGNAWFIEKVYPATTADEEMEMMDVIDPAFEAVISGASEALASYDITAEGVDENAEIYLTHYSPNRLEYKYSSPQDAVAVFSEIYYPAGWKAFVDGVEKPILRADYVLRALELEAGEHTVEFIYSPKSFKTGKSISLASSIIILLLLVAGIAYEAVPALRGKKKEE